MAAGAGGGELGVIGHRAEGPAEQKAPGRPRAQLRRVVHTRETGRSHVVSPPRLGAGGGRRVHFRA